TTLFDVVVFEGIASNLTPGVGISLEQRSKSLSLMFERQPLERTQSLQLLGAVVAALNGISANGDYGLAPMVRRRSQVDLIAGTAELGFNSAGKEEWRVQFKKMLDGYGQTHCYSQGRQITRVPESLLRHCYR